MSSIGELLRQASGRLHGADGASEAQLLLAHLLGRDRSWLFAWSEREVDPETAHRYRDLVAQRAGGTPIAYLTSRRDFWTLALEVNPHTLIPRPETEHLVEQALSCGGAESALRVLDLGTGSGAIALALASERPHWRITACDVSQEALKVARSNAARLRLGNMQFLHSDWFGAISGSFDLIVSNPPYIAADDPHLAQGDLRFEPPGALAAGPDGLDDIRRITAASPRHLNAGGWLWFEHGHDQGRACRALLQQHGFQAIDTRRDLAGLERLSGGRTPT